MSLIPGTKTAEPSSERNVMKKSHSTKRSDGRLVKTVKDTRTGKRIYFYGKTEREINKKILEYSSQNMNGRMFKDVASEWWESIEPRLAIQSLKTYRPACNRAVAEFGNIQINTILPQNIENFIKKISARGYAQKTVSNQKLILNLIFEFAITQNDIQYNPCSSIHIPKGLSKKTRTAASPEDEETVKKTYNIWLFPYFALMTGMRKGEILALQWKDINFNENLITVSKSVYHDGDRPYIKEPKTEAGNRLVPLLLPLKNVLQIISIKSPDSYIISDDGSKPLTNRRFITLYNNYRKVTGITCTAHQLRHSFATIAFEYGIDAKTVQEILGHKQLSTTMDLYTEFRKKALISATEKLNKIIK